LYFRPQNSVNQRPTMTLLSSADMWLCPFDGVCPAAPFGAIRR
jgi:hypothetical protein